MAEEHDVLKTFRNLVENAERKFARVRDLPVYVRGQTNHHHKVFNAYTKLWKFQLENRACLVEAGLQRWEIGEVASRIGQLYFGQYMRTSQARFLFESYIFYEAILKRGYFEGSKNGSSRDIGLRFKELRFYARFLVVSLLLNQSDLVPLLFDRFRLLVAHSKASCPESSFKEWMQISEEITRFIKADVTFCSTKSLRYSPMIDNFEASSSNMAQYRPRNVLKFKDALLASYNRNEVKLAELTLDTYRMLQCLEWDSSANLSQIMLSDSKDSTKGMNCFETSGQIDSTLLSNPRKAILYHPSTLAVICEELSPGSVVLVYLSASGKDYGDGMPQKTDITEIHQKSLKNKGCSQFVDKDNTSNHKSSENYMWFGGSNNLYPSDLIPFTRKPLLLIIDSDNSHAFKDIHGCERGETTLLLLSPLKKATKYISSEDISSGGQFTFFLTAPLHAFSQLVGISVVDMDVEKGALDIIYSGFSRWEVELFSTPHLHPAWARVVSDPFLRRLVLRFIFCRAVLFLLMLGEGEEERGDHLPYCLPVLPESFSPNREPVCSTVYRLAHHLNSATLFHILDNPCS